MAKQFQFGNTPVGGTAPTFTIAELSGNHDGSKQKALEMVAAAAESGASAVKVQTYTADTITLNSRQPDFMAEGLWEGRSLYDLYEEAHMPWDWQGDLSDACKAAGIEFFSSPFDLTAVDFLESINVPAYKIASFELVDVGLIEAAAATGKPLIISTGMGTLAEIEEAVQAARSAGNGEIALLVCTSAYPAPASAARLRKITHLAETFDVVTGLSDHTIGPEVPIAAVAMGAKVIEKHFTLRRSDGGVDSAFSLEPDEFAELVSNVRTTEEAMGAAVYGPSEADESSRDYRRSLFITRDLKEGEAFQAGDIRSVRPGSGLHPRHLHDFDGHVVSRAAIAGTPLTWEHLGERASE